ncbi:MAG: hypothetical protein KGZ83_20900 [Sulfuricella sp.]|nr:hypothetical protein [Sulfuricella sp.]
MTALTSRNQLIVGIVLAALLAATRSHHFAGLHHLPDASWAVFFLAGVYLRRTWVFPALLAGAAASDFIAITWGGVSSFCVSPAYALLLPAYGALWLAGRKYAQHHANRIATLVPLVLAVCGGAALCELLSSGGFYFFSGRYAEPTLAEFGLRLVKYFPAYLGTLALYVGCAAVVHAVLVGVTERSTPANQP